MNHQLKPSTLLCLLIGLAILLQPAKSISAGNAFPLIEVDEAHLRTERADGSQAISYRIPATSGITLETIGYDFGDMESQLNLIFVSQGPKQQYALKWEPGKTRYEVSTKTLRPIDGSQNFVGFKSGDEIVLFIGRLKEGSSLSAVWAGTIEVK